jgi:transposase, IS30 family
MACHDQIAHLLSDGVFFASPGRPWERPSNENTDGLLRQSFPKRTDLSVHGIADLKTVEQRLNNRPRKTLGWLMPAQVLAAGAPSP